MRSRIITAFVLCVCFLTISAFAQKSKESDKDKIADKFTEAAQYGKLEEIKSMIASGVDVNIERSSFKGWTALMAASTFGQPQMVKYLIAKGANVNVRLKDGETALYQSAQNENNREIVEALIKAGVEINAQTKEKRTALLRFAWMGHVDAIKMLLDAGADTKITDEKGVTAFYFACAYGNNTQIVKYFLNAGANPNEKDAKGQTPLMWTGWGERSENFKALVAAGADVNAKDADGTTPLMISASRFFPNEVKILLDAKADVNARDKKGRNALMYASASIFRYDEIGAHGDGMTVWLGATKILETLIAAGTDVNAQNNDGETALMLATKMNNAHFAETLLNKGANPDLKNKNGKMAKDYAGKDYARRRKSLLEMSGRIK